MVTFPTNGAVRRSSRRRDRQPRHQPVHPPQSRPEHDVTGDGTVLYDEFETFGLQQGSDLREPLNQAIADLQASGEVDAIVDRWLD